MGNSESKDDSSIPSDSTSPRAERRSGGGSVNRRRDAQARTRHSVSHATRSQPFNPTTNLLSSSASKATATSTSATNASAATRPRSITAGSSHQHHLAVRDLLPHSHRSDHSDTMGANESKPHPRPPSRASTLPSQATPPPADETTEPPDERAPPEPIAEPVEVPPAPPLSHQDVFSDKDDIIPSSYVESPFSAPISNYSRPPRLPLPIEEEVLAPGSPILSPEDIKDITTPLEQADVEAGAIPSKTLSSTTVDEDEIVDNDAFAPEASQYEVRVPTKLEWNGDGDKVFVTGTFCNWERKIKLHKNKDNPGFSATVNLRPGTHHIKFLVDGEMVTSPELPTTVDWINILVNYIEIVAPMPPAAEEDKQPPAPAAPMPIPGAAITAGQAKATNDPTAQTRTPGMDPQTSSPEADLLATIERVNREYERSINSDPGGRADRANANATAPPAQKPRPTPALKQNIPRPIYTNRIPDFLIDLDNFNNPDGEERYQRAQKVSKVLPEPPTLPGFLNKSILNGTTPHKDDASVLIMPNHTVLNHLATSSIKNGVLATSGTTRYKRKFLTTIMYKPTSDDG